MICTWSHQRSTVTDKHKTGTQFGVLLEYCQLFCAVIWSNSSKKRTNPQTKYEIYCALSLWWKCCTQKNILDAQSVSHLTGTWHKSPKSILQCDKEALIWNDLWLILDLGMISFSRFYGPLYGDSLAVINRIQFCLWSGSKQTNMSLSYCAKSL